MGDLDTLSEIFKRDSNSDFSRELSAAARQVPSARAGYTEQQIHYIDYSQT